MSSHEFTRRRFLQGASVAAAAGMAGPGMLFSADALGAANSYDTVIHVFLRGGIDGLNLVVPISGNDRALYEDARPTLAIPATGAYAALPLTLSSGAQTGFGLHPSASGLRDLWNLGKLAIVHSCGIKNTVTRSHFDAQLYLDSGTPGRKGTGTGWLARSWNAQAAAASMPLLAVNSRQPASLMGSAAALTMGRPSDLTLNTTAWQWQTYRSSMPAGTKGLSETVAAMWGGSSALETDGRNADASRRLVGGQAYTDTLPSGFPTSSFARQLWTVAQSVRFNLGLRYATVDLGGWDTHEGQGTAGSGYHYYQNMVAELSQALTALYVELAASGHADRVTVIVQSEFGRRVRQNGSGGTDHGYGNPLLVLGGPVNGRRFFGRWDGLAPEILSPNFGDIPVNTDYRQVLSEILIRRMGNNKISSIFPQYDLATYTPLNVVRGTHVAPV